MTPIEAAEADITALAEKVGDGELDQYGDALKIEAELKRIASASGATLDACRTMFKHKVRTLVVAVHEQPRNGLDEAEKATRRAEAWAVCKNLAFAPDLIEQLCATARRLGVAGDRRGIVSTFLVMISRLLSDPIAMVRKGSSASGKNHVIDKLLELLPEDEFLRLVGMSPKSIFYMERDFRHNLIVIPEAEALVPVTRSARDDASMFMRELISHKRLCYATLQQAPDGKWHSIILEKEGSVAVLITTARSNIEEELGTRLLDCVTDETVAQTQRIMRARAQEAAGQGPPPVTDDQIAGWHTLQLWLRYGPCEVAIPFAAAIAEGTDPTAQRIRRDLGQIFSMTMASALLHRAQRPIDEHGRIVATRFDYALAIGSLGEGLSEQAHGETTALEKVREAVVQALAECRRRWGREETMGMFALAYVMSLPEADRSVAAKRIGGWSKAQKGTVSIGGLVAFIAAAGLRPIGSGTRALWKKAVSEIRSAADPTVLVAPAMQANSKLAAALGTLSASRPNAVPMSYQSVADRIGVTYKVVRTRVAEAIEAGLVIDVGAADRTRSPTAPKLLAPGQEPGASRVKAPHGAFPAADALPA